MSEPILNETLDELEAAHSLPKGGGEYVDRLRKLRSDASDKEMAVCRAWNGEKFGWPGHGDSHWVATELTRAQAAVTAIDAVVTPIILTCPVCGGRHIDVGRFATHPHHTHSCQHCGYSWRPTKGPTCGVQYLPGFKNEGDDDLVPCTPIAAPLPSLVTANRAVREMERQLMESAALVEGLARANRFLRAEMTSPEQRGAVVAETEEERIEVERARAKSNQLLHRLWTKAVGTSDYLKREWQELESTIFTLLRVARGGKKTWARLDAEGAAEPLTELQSHPRVRKHECFVHATPADTHVDLQTGKKTPLDMHDAPPTDGEGEDKS